LFFFIWNSFDLLKDRLSDQLTNLRQNLLFLLFETQQFKQLNFDQVVEIVLKNLPLRPFVADEVVQGAFP
jgi:hypothetical protein